MVSNRSRSCNHAVVLLSVCSYKYKRKLCWLLCLFDVQSTGILYRYGTGMLYHTSCRMWFLQIKDEHAYRTYVLPVLSSLRERMSNTVITATPTGAARVAGDRDQEIDSLQYCWNIYYICIYIHPPIKESKSLSWMNHASCSSYARRRTENFDPIQSVQFD